MRLDLGDAITEIAAVRDDGIAALRTVAAAELGAVLKREASAIVADRLDRAIRICSSVMEIICPGRRRELAAARDEAVDDDA